jgi:hypothetical protein
MTGSSAKNGCHYGTSTYAIANAKRAYPNRQLGSPFESNTCKRLGTKTEAGHSSALVLTRKSPSLVSAGAQAYR